MVKCETASDARCIQLRKLLIDQISWNKSTHSAELRMTPTAL